MIPLSGYVSRALGMRLTFVISAAGFTLASLACAFAQNMDHVITSYSIHYTKLYELGIGVELADPDVGPSARVDALDEVVADLVVTLRREHRPRHRGRGHVGEVHRHQHVARPVV